MSAAARVWGRADAFDLTFDMTKGGDWEASVPADLEDGQYVCEIWAENTIGEQTYWTGTLYMVDGHCVYLRLESDLYITSLIPDTYEIRLIRGCCHAGAL